MANKLSFFSLSMSCFFLAACSPNPETTDTSNTPFPQATVGASISSIETNPFFQGMYQSLEKVGKEQSNLNLMLDHAANQQDKQNTQLDSMIERGAKALVVNLADVKFGAEMVKKYCDKTIPVVYINRSPSDKALASCETAYFVDGDAAQAGVLQGLQVLKAFKANPQWDKNQDGKIQYAMIEGIPNHAGAMARTKWAVGTMENYPNLGMPVEQVFQEYAMFQAQAAKDLTTKWLTLPEFARVEVILANNDTMALGALEILQANGQKVPVFGIDGSKVALNALHSGSLSGTVFNDFDAQSRTAVRMAANLAAGKPVLEGVAYGMEYKVVKIPYQDIHSDNLNQFIQIQQ
ncbi:MAG: galactose ABC transporter substrate-binding protein [Alysiella sp.]|uniref:galactose ABC transporter substrate-binding protein n=1 Tax=Alysiella sp. TaxID=1872483 RepID=UPI0026DB1F78|nr:galactose ABC transporter substrate-binding protein [Alysiella sp.]MDO4433700.1 galactose ABC transporter substrate-binding protein [Alysiella sp.]